MTRLLVSAAAIAALTGCWSVSINGATTRGGSTGASGGSGFSTSGGSGSDAAASSAGTSRSSGSSTGSATGATSTGGNGTSAGGNGSSGTTTGLPPPPIIDGGYVFCSAIDDGGVADWLCTPGTYFCSDAVGTCLQCRSDADCADQSLPTFDFQRPHCDVNSGWAGYQNFCEQCLDDADCAGNPAGPLCDLNPFYPPSGSPVMGGSTEAPIETLGFESCGKVQTDCRVDGGPSCDRLDAFCDEDSGRCRNRNVQDCSSDADCAGVMATGGFNLLFPYCVQSQIPSCSPCQDGYCPGGQCNSDVDCINPNDEAASETCNQSLGYCICTASSQCGGFWPICELQSGLFDEHGQPAGFCGCDSSSQCGDAGLICFEFDAGGSFCGPSCTRPGFPACARVPISGIEVPRPVCDPLSGQCVSCTTDEQCRTGRDTGGAVCSDGGYCTCRDDADCSAGQTCQVQGGEPTYIACRTAPLPCTPDSCGLGFCDWDSGLCQDAGAGPYGGPFGCIDDFDCAGVYSEGAEPFCDQIARHCVECLGDTDCVKSSAGAGQVCLGGVCGCATGSDCLAGLGCRNGMCFPCVSDAECAANEFCDPASTCRPRCDPGHACQGPEMICDVDDVAGHNGMAMGGTVAAAVWCYACLSPGDCNSGSCDSLRHTCGSCSQGSDCATGFECGRGACVASCDAGACPGGSICYPGSPVSPLADVCVECLGPIDCPNGEGCDSETQTCGRCRGPKADGVGSDCPPGGVCSNYWSVLNTTGVCLADCDLRSCPADRPICAVLPNLTPDHAYCFGCLSDADCTSLGAGAWCDVSVNLTFTCQLPR